VTHHPSASDSIFDIGTLIIHSFTYLLTPVDKRNTSYKQMKLF